MLEELNGQCEKFTESDDVEFNSAVDLSSGFSTMHDTNIDSQYISSGDYVDQDIAASM